MKNYTIEAMQDDRNGVLQHVLIHPPMLSYPVVTNLCVVIKN